MNTFVMNDNLDGKSTYIVPQKLKANQYRNN